MSTNFANLGMENVIRDTARKLDKHMLAFFFSKYSQSILYRGGIISLPKLIQMYGNSEQEIRDAVQKALTDKLTAHFTTVSVEVSVETMGGNMTLVIDANVSDENDIESGTVSVGFTLNITESRIKSIFSKLSETPIFISA